MRQVAATHLDLPLSVFHLSFIRGSLPASLCAFLCFSWPFPCAAQPADLVLRGGKIVTIDDRQPEAEALAVAGDRIVAVGSAAEINQRIGPSTRVIELTGRMAMPGFIEGHGHFLSLGDSKRKLDL